jgi:acyl carrier protein
MDEQLKSVMASVFGLDAKDITETSSAETIENWDSLQHIKLIVALEEEFGVELENEDITTMISFTEIKKVIHKLQNENIK